MSVRRASVTHDLNNVLTKILGAAELALDVAEHPGVRRELELIAALAEQGGWLVRELDAPPARKRA
jgi:signal transduction histidine kinase